MGWWGWWYPCPVEARLCPYRELLPVLPPLPDPANPCRTLPPLPDPANPATPAGLPHLCSTLPGTPLPQGMSDLQYWF